MEYQIVTQNKKRKFDQTQNTEGDGFIPKVIYTQREFDFYEKKRALKDALDSIVKIPSKNYSPNLQDSLDILKKNLVEEIANFYIEYKDILVAKFNASSLEEIIKNKLIEFHSKWPDWSAKLYKQSFNSPIPARRVYGTSGGFKL